MSAYCYLLAYYYSGKHRLSPDDAITKQTIRALVLQATAGTHTHLQHIIHITSHLPPHAYVHHSHPEDLFQRTNECCLTRSRLALQALNLPRQPFRLLLHASTLRSYLEMSGVHATFNPWLLCSACADVVLHTIPCFKWLPGTFHCFLCTPSIHNYHHLDVKKQLGRTRVGLFRKSSVPLFNHLLRPTNTSSQPRVFSAL